MQNVKCPRVKLGLESEVLVTSLLKLIYQFTYTCNRRELAYAYFKDRL